jgi:hypothetical protein
MSKSLALRLAFVLLFSALFSLCTKAQTAINPHITSPEQAFGFKLGTDL